MTLPVWGRHEQVEFLKTIPVSRGFLRVRANSCEFLFWQGLLWVKAPTPTPSPLATSLAAVALLTGGSQRAPFRVRRAYSCLNLWWRIRIVDNNNCGFNYQTYETCSNSLMVCVFVLFCMLVARRGCVNMDRQVIGRCLSCYTCNLILESPRNCCLVPCSNTRTVNTTFDNGKARNWLSGMFLLLTSRSFRQHCEEPSRSMQEAFVPSSKMCSPTDSSLCPRDVPRDRQSKPAANTPFNIAVSSVPSQCPCHIGMNLHDYFILFFKTRSETLHGSVGKYST